MNEMIHDSPCVPPRPVDASGVLASLPEPLIVVRACDGHVVLANRAAEAWLDADARGLSGHACVDRETLGELSTGEHELVLVGPDGRARRRRVAVSQSIDPHHGSLWLLMPSRGEPAGDLEVTLARYRRVEFGTDEGLWEWLPGTGENYFSPRWCALLGYGPDELPQRVETFMSRVHPDDLAMLFEAVERHRRGEAHFVVKHRMLHRDGSYRWMRSQGRFTYDDGVERLTGLLTDITERKRIETALQEAQRLARLGAWESELATGKTWWSDQMYAILGIEPGSPMTTDRVTAMVHDQERETFLAGVREVLEHDSHVGQYRMVRPDGRIAHVRLIGRVQRDASGQAIRMCGACLDVSEQVAAEQAVARSLAEKDTLLREIHHRVKNNLAVVGSLLHFHGMQLDSPHDVEVLDGLRRRIHAMSLVHDRLYQLPNVASVEFGDYARLLVADLCRGSSSTGIEIAVEMVEHQLPVEVAMPLGQITCELLTNVLKYAFVGGGPGHARVSLDHVETSGCLVVEDEGVGLPDGFSPERCGSFGWLLIRSLVRQLEGAFVLGRAASGSGTRVEVHFPWPSQSLEP